MIYVSSSCIQAETIRESVTTLSEAGFKNIELSSGTSFYPEYESDLLRLQEKYELNFLVHNYFPPSKKPFVLNLASLNDEIFDHSIKHCKKAIDLSRKLCAKRYGVHAGFLIDIEIYEIGKQISFTDLSDRKRAINRFRQAWEKLVYEAEDNPALYIENNVLSKTNVNTFKGNNPFLFTDYKGYLELNDHMVFRPLLDLAHLKVSANSLGLDLVSEVKQLLPLTDYIHVSENDGLHDQNKELSSGGNILNDLKDFDFKSKIVVLEICQDLDLIKLSYSVIEQYLGIN